MKHLVSGIVYSIKRFIKRIYLYIWCFISGLSTIKFDDLETQDAERILYDDFVHFDNKDDLNNYDINKLFPQIIVHYRNNRELKRLVRLLNICGFKGRLSVDSKIDVAWFKDNRKLVAIDLNKKDCRDTNPMMRQFNGANGELFNFVDFAKLVSRCPNLFID